MARKSIKTAIQLKEEIINNPDFDINPEDFDKLPIHPLKRDVVIYRMVVIILGLTVLTIVAGVIVEFISDDLTSDKQIPTILTAAVSTALGAIAGLLAPQPNQE